MKFDNTLKKLSIIIEKICLLPLEIELVVFKLITHCIIYYKKEGWSKYHRILKGGRREV